MSMLSANEFKTCLSKMLDVGRVIIEHDTRFGSGTIFVKAANNRAIFSVSGFDSDPDKLIDRATAEQITSVFTPRLRKKTSDPWTLVFYLAKHINALGKAGHK